MSNELQKPSIGELLKKQPLLIADAIQNFNNIDTAPNFLVTDYGISSLSELQEMFDWDVRYVLCSEHFVMCKTITLRTDVSSLEEAEEYLNGNKKIYASSSDWEAYDPDFENDCEIESSEIITEIVNVRLKSQPQSKDAAALD